MVKKISVISIVVGITLLLPTFSSLLVSLNESNTQLPITEIVDEEYTPDIASINSIHEFESQIRNEIDERNLSGIDVPILVDDYVRQKFYHRYAQMSWYNNWTLSLVDWVFPQYEVMGYMRPEEIVRFDYGICNQQAIVFQTVLMNLGFEYGSIRFSSPDFGHFTSAVKVDNEWYYFDSNLEPRYDRGNSAIFQRIISGDTDVLTNIYGDRFEGFSSEMVEFGNINEFPASRGVLVQDLTGWFSWYGWTVFLFPGFVVMWYRRRTQESTKSEVP